MSNDDLRRHIASHARTTVRLRARDLLPRCVIEFKGTWYEVMDVAITKDDVDISEGEIVTRRSARVENSLLRTQAPPGVDGIEAAAHLSARPGVPIQVAIRVIDPRLDSLVDDIRDIWLVLPANQLLETQTDPA